MESIAAATTPSGSQNLEQGSLSTAATVVIILTVIAFVALTAALVGILVRKYRKRRYRYYPAFKHKLLEEDENAYSQTGTIARFGKLYILQVSVELGSFQGIVFFFLLM